MGDENEKRLDKLKARLSNKGKIVIRFAQLPEDIQRNILAYNISITNSSDNDISEYFRYLQNQERLRVGEIITLYQIQHLKNIC